MVMGIQNQEWSQIKKAEQNDPTIIGFDEEKRRHQQRLKINRQQQIQLPKGPYTFQSYQAWEKDGLDPKPKFALKLLHRLASDKAIVSIMQKNKWSVGKLCEMPPEGQVNIDPVCILGYNVNKGQEIHLRLRTDNMKGFRWYLKIRQTLIHELTHNVWSEHDSNFKELNSQLLKMAQQIDDKHIAHKLDGTVHRSDHEMLDHVLEEEEDEEAHVIDSGWKSNRLASQAARLAAINRQQIQNQNRVDNRNVREYQNNKQIQSSNQPDNLIVESHNKQQSDGYLSDDDLKVSEDPQTFRLEKLAEQLESTNQASQIHSNQQQTIFTNQDNEKVNQQHIHNIKAQDDTSGVDNQLNIYPKVIQHNQLDNQPLKSDTFHQIYAKGVQEQQEFTNDIIDHNEKMYVDEQSKDIGSKQPYNTSNNQDTQQFDLQQNQNTSITDIEVDAIEQNADVNNGNNNQVQSQLQNVQKQENEQLDMSMFADDPMIEKSNQLHKAIQTFKRLNIAQPRSLQYQCLNTLYKIFQNLFENQSQTKFQQFKTSSQSFQNQLLPFQGVTEILKIGGFQLDQANQQWKFVRMDFGLAWITAQILEQEKINLAY